MERRLFLSNLGLSLASCAVSPSLAPSKNIFQAKLSSDKPKAIAMWDFSWLLRTYDGGGFESYDKALDELSLRGYDAIRIDCFPQFIGQDDFGEVSDRIFLPKKKTKFTLWGNEVPITIEPKRKLVEFLRKCQSREISIVLSSWFYGHGTRKNAHFSEVSGLVRAWDQTLQFINDHGLMENVLYVDLLNEYPLWHGYTWLTNEMNSRGTSNNAPFDFLNLDRKRQFNGHQIKFYNDFINQVISALKIKWAELNFTASQTNTLNTPWQDLDCTQFDVMDIHQWMIYNQQFSQSTGYFQGIHTLKDEKQFGPTYRKIKDYWLTNKESLTEWLAGSIQERAIAGKKLNIPFGCTEGWGAVMWMDHKDLNWSFIKECGLIAANLGAQHGYYFNCSSNFTHPHFETLWKDIPWHKEVTKTIRKI